MRGAAFTVLIAVLSLSACGQKGPLYLPQDTAPAATDNINQPETGSEKPVDAP